jgi:hypothetical protein
VTRGSREAVFGYAVVAGTISHRVGLEGADREGASVAVVLQSLLLTVLSEQYLMRRGWI